MGSLSRTCLATRELSIQPDSCGSSVESAVLGQFDLHRWFRFGMRSNLTLTLIYLSLGEAGATLGFQAWILLHKSTRISSHHLCGVYLCSGGMGIKNSLKKTMLLGKKSSTIIYLKTFPLFSMALIRLFGIIRKNTFWTCVSVH